MTKGIDCHSLNLSKVISRRNSKVLNYLNYVNLYYCANLTMKQQNDSVKKIQNHQLVDNGYKYTVD